MRILSILLILLLFAAPVNAQLGTVPYTFVSGNTILSTQVNSNFSTAYANALNRTGGTITGTIAISADVTIDGVDLSDFLSPSGIVFSGTAGAVGAPSFSRTGDTNTGIYFPAADQLALTLGGVQKLLLDTNGVTAYGVNLINSSGKIPALTSTYFASVSFDSANLTGTAAAINGSAITNLTAANVTGAHTLPDGVLSTNVPLLDASNIFNGATNSFAVISASGAISAGGALSTTGSNFAVSGAGADLELGSVASGNIPFIDFHSSGNNIDYDSRIAASGGSGSIGTGTLAITAGTLSITAQTVISLLQFGGSALVANTGNTGSLAATNFPGVTATVHGWESIRLSDGSTGYIPVWK